MNSLLSIEATIDLIRSGAALCLAAEESCLNALPAGNWIAGTIPYFMAAQGGVKTKRQVFVTRIADNDQVRLMRYESNALQNIATDCPDDGYSVVIMPYGSSAHERFATDCRNYEGAFLKPIVGWISGIDLDFLGKQTPKVYDGRSAAKYTDSAVVAHVRLPAGKLASIEVVNIFEPDGKDVVRFAQSGFSAVDCTVNGQPRRLVDFLAERGNTDGKLPLVGDYHGTYGNAAIQSVDALGGTVRFYGPVFPDVEYWLAKPVGDYAASFERAMQTLDGADVAFSCNCAVNYVYGALEGKPMRRLHGPITFGEIGYQLLTQTLVALRID